MRSSPTAQLNVQIRRRLVRQARVRRFRRAIRIVQAAVGVAAVLGSLYGLTFIPAVERLTPKVLHLAGQGTVLASLDALNDSAVLDATVRRACLPPRYRRAFSATPTTAWITWTALRGSQPARSRLDCRTLRVL